MIRFLGCAVLTVALALQGNSRATATDHWPPGDDPPDARALLREVGRHYSRAERYRIEAVVELQMDSELSSAWNKSLMTAASESARRYRFEVHSLAGSLVQVCDGRTERIYQASSNQYLERKGPGRAPTRFSARASHEQEGLDDAHDLTSDISDLLLAARNPVCLPDETLTLAGEKPFPCYVIQASPRNPSAGSATQLTFWIDKQTRLVRKIKDHTEGRLIAQSTEHNVQDEITTYPVTELDVTSFQESLFRLDIGKDWKRVRQLADPDRGGLAKQKDNLAPQVKAPEDSDPGALTLLRKVGERYANAQSYHLEGISENRSETEFFRFCSKEHTTAVLAPGNRYRFGIHRNGAWRVNISDGKTNWTYRPDLQEYTRDSAAPAERHEGDAHLKQAELQLRNIVKSLSELPKTTRSVRALPDETLDLAGARTLCHVVRASPAEQSASPGFGQQLTLWIDPNTLAIRKIHTHGEAVAGPYVFDITTTYARADVDLPSGSEDDSWFNPPSSARLVAAFDSPAPAPASDSGSDSPPSLVGQLAPSINLTRADGKIVSLDSFRGAPLLVEFWATWCGPCIASMPETEKLYRRFIPRGLVVLSIDEDNDPQKAIDLHAKRRHSWPNFHDEDSAALDAFHGDGIPHFALIDSSGQIVFSMSGFDKSKLRAALSRVDSKFR